MNSLDDEKASWDGGKNQIMSLRLQLAPVTQHCDLQQGVSSSVKVEDANSAEWLGKGYSTDISMYFMNSKYQ